MGTKWEQSGELWPGIIAIKPFETIYTATYRTEQKEFKSYGEAEQWILKMKEVERQKNALSSV